MDIKYSTDPKCSKGFDTTELRNHYLIDNLFAPGEGNFTYSHIDRVIVAGIMPADDTITLNAENELGADYFFERREGGIINIGAHGIVILDGRGITLENSDALYIGKGTKTVEFVSRYKCNPALFYMNVIRAEG